jgi:APA family basic amino acid/polyamine antiporter
VTGNAPAPAGLKRQLGLTTVTLSGIGIILGAGIYVLIGTAAGDAGNAVWLSFLISAVIALCTALSYAELSSMFPRAAAEYDYTTHSFGDTVAFVIGWLIIFSGMIGAATVALGFGGYLHALAGIPPIAGALLILALLSLILFAGIRESAGLAVVFTLIEAGGLIGVIVAGIPYLGTVDYLEMPFGIGGVLSGAALVFFAFLGFEEMVKFSEETRDPERTVPRALLIALAASTLIYIFVALAAVSTVGWEALSTSDAPFSLVASVAWGVNGAVALSVIALFATANTILLMLYATSRITYGMAGSGALPPVFSRVNLARQTPVAAVIVSAIGAAIFLFAGDIGFVAGVTNFTVFVTFIVVNLTVLILRYRDPLRPRPFRTPVSIGRMAVFPLIGLLSCFFLITELDPPVILTGSLIGAAGVAIAVAVKTREKIPG